jgi:exodeoxyribonuclease-1
MDIFAYDTETTDVDVQHAQVLQFAAIRADENFDIVSEEEILVKRLPYVVPAPTAMAVTGFDVAELDSAERRSEYKFAGQIESSTKPRYGRKQINLTFNGLKFDDEILRMTLFRNLRNPWFNSGKDIRRVDLLPLIRLIHTVDENLIKIPVKADGAFSWKLSDVCAANGIVFDAHDAMEDVRGTIALARLIKEQAPAIWAEAVNCGNAANSEFRLSDQIARGVPAWVFTYFGKPELIPAGVLATDGRKKWILADLRSPVQQTIAQEIAGALYSPESSFRVVRSNAGQLVVSDEIAELLIGRTEMDVMRKAAAVMKDDAKLRSEAARALSISTFEMPSNPTSEERLYDGFAKDSDRSKMTAFHNADSWLKRAQIVFEDDRLSDFAARIVIEAVIEDRARDVPEEVVLKLLARCSSALDRPFGDESATPFSIAKAHTTGADEQWKAWADAAFAPLADLLGKAKPQEAKEFQASFSFGN